MIAVKKYKISTRELHCPADLHTPAGIYLRLRDHFPDTLLLESSDHHGRENSRSFICCDPIATFNVAHERIRTSFPDGLVSTREVLSPSDVLRSLSEFLAEFSCEGLRGPAAGVFGFTSFNTVRYFENRTGVEAGSDGMPDMHYALYRYVICINHFNDEMIIYENVTGKEKGTDVITGLLRNRSVPVYPFKLRGTETSDTDDAGFLEMVREGRRQCAKGNVFQVVLSRCFSRPFAGDDFNVYRALRMINPSPYLFYYDLGNFRIFGSSPEAQLVVKNGKAEIHPIAGTFRRTGNESMDAELAEKLRKDTKEQSEHIMLVDLARNDLSRCCRDVKVEVTAETQYYSHVIHLVSKVTGMLPQGQGSLELFAKTFPAGTLSGAPKHEALNIISRVEKSSRGYYGGALGYFGFNGDINHAIIIRSFLSRSNRLNYRAGAGVVVASTDSNELQEVNNKLAALRAAMENAGKL